MVSVSTNSAQNVSLDRHTLPPAPSKLPSAIEDQLIRPLDLANPAHAFINEAGRRAGQGRRCTEALFAHLELVSAQGVSSRISATLIVHPSNPIYGSITSMGEWERLSDLDTVHRASFLSSMKELSTTDEVLAFSRKSDGRVLSLDHLLSADVHPLSSIAGLRNYAGHTIEISYVDARESEQYPGSVVGKLTEVLDAGARPILAYQREDSGKVRHGRVGQAHDIQSVALVSATGTEYGIKGKFEGLTDLARSTVHGTQIQIRTTVFDPDKAGSAIVLSGRYLGLNESRNGVLVETALPGGSLPTRFCLAQNLIQSIQVPSAQESPKVLIYKSR